MSDKKVLRLTCPVCETRLKIADDLERFACLTCGTELSVIKEGGLATLKPTGESAAEMSPTQRELIEVNQALKQSDDAFGVGCALATMGITLVACILLSVAILLQSQPLFWLTIVAALALLGAVLFMFTAASSRSTDPLLRQRDQLQAEVEQEAAETQPNPEEEQAKSGSDGPEPQAI
jgi:hypothetical protein